MIQKINCDSEIDEQKTKYIPEARSPRKSTKYKRWLVSTPWKISLPLSIFPFPAKKKKKYGGVLIFCVSTHGGQVGTPASKGREHREHMWAKRSPAKWTCYLSRASAVHHCVEGRLRQPQSLIALISFKGCPSHADLPPPTHSCSLPGVQAAALLPQMASTPSQAQSGDSQPS